MGAFVAPKCTERIKRIADRVIELIWFADWIKSC